MSLIGERELPALLYKYIKMGTFIQDLLNGESLKFSRPSEFNDPFDCAPAIFIPHGKSAREFLSKMPLRPDLTSSQRRLLKRNAKKKVVGKLITAEKQASTGNLLEKTGVCSLCEMDNNILMWSHYADQHRGICIGFDSSKHFFQTAWPVNYQTTYPIVIRPNDSDLEILQKTILTKSSCWEYEQEWRMIRRTMSNEEHYIQRLQYEGTEDSEVFLDQRGPGYYRFPKEAVKQVVFGLKTPQTDKSMILKFLSLHNPSTKVFQLKKHPSKFELIKVPVTAR